MENTYLKEFQELFDDFPDGTDPLEKRYGFRPLKEWARRKYGLCDVFTIRKNMVRRYSWSTPNEEALQALNRFGPYVSVGAGTGYWEALLRDRGVDVAAYDETPPDNAMSPSPGTTWAEFADHGGSYEIMEAARVNLFHPGFSCWTEIQKGGPESVARHPGWDLFLSWPPMSDMAARCLDHFTGSHVAYVGEWGGCTADEDFHARLVEDFEEIVQVNIPTWWGIHDTLSVWKKRTAPQAPIQESSL